MGKRIIQCPICSAILEVDPSGLARELQWWELLDWKTMPKTFDKLPTSIKNEIRVKLGVGSDWHPSKEV
jgi:hypothetical protein